MESHFLFGFSLIIKFSTDAETTWFGVERSLISGVLQTLKEDKIPPPKSREMRS